MSQETVLTDAQAWLNSRRSNMAFDLIDLANQNSGSNNLAGLEQVAQWLEDWMDIPESRFQSVPLPPRRIIDDSGIELSIEAAPALRWDCRPDAARRVLLGIHYDTVYGPNHALQKCNWISSERLGGPGVADAKGGLVILRYALQAVERFSLAAACGWTIVLNPDEEIGSPSSSRLLRDLASDYDFGLWFEPALAGGALVSERKGSGTFIVVARGRSAHAGRHFEQGRNAIAHLGRLVESLDRLNGQRPGVTINVGHFVGGGPVNVVPDLAVARFNVRVKDREQQAWVETEIHALIEDFSKSEGLTCQLHGSFHAPPKLMTPPQRQLMRAVEDAAQRLGQAVQWQSTGGVCDGNKLAAAGLPNIDTLGAIGDGLHSSQEWVSVDSMPQKSLLIAELLSNYSVGQFSL